MARSFKFDGELVPNVLNDKTKSYGLTGFYIGKFGKYMYAVINPTKLDIHVWTKQNDTKFNGGDYVTSAKKHARVVCTNGPPMESRMGPGDPNMYLGFADSLAKDTPWDSWGVVISGGKKVTAGKGYQKWFFQRIGSKSFPCYKIGKGEPDKNALEALGGCYGIVDNGNVVSDNDTKNLKKKQGSAVWCLRPKLKKDPAGFGGAIIVVAVRGFMTDLASRITKVGCSYAVAMDGSDSVVAGFGKELKIKCDWKKDRIQRWGLYCK